MAVDFALDCKFPNDLEAAVRNLEEVAGARIRSADLQLTQIEDEIISSNAFNAIDEIQEIFEGLLRQGEGNDVRSYDDMSQVLGSPVFAGNTSTRVEPALTEEVAAARKQSQKEADEIAVFDAGGIMHDGAFYFNGELSDTPKVKDNIQVLRDLYVSNSKDLDAVEEVLTVLKKKVPEGKELEDLSLKPILFQSQLSIEKIPAIKNGSESVPFEVVAERFGLAPGENEGQNDPANYVVLNNVTYVINQKFLGTDLPKKQILNKNGVEDYDIVTEAYHINKKEVRPERIREVSLLGYTGTESGAIFRFKQTGIPDDKIRTQITANTNAASLLISQIEFFAKRFQGESELVADTASKLNFLKKTKTSFQNLLNGHRKIFSSIMFNVQIIKDIDVLIDLQRRHSDDEIKRMLDKRPEIKGIDFNKTTAEVDKEISKVIAGNRIPSTKISANFMKRQATNPVFDQTALMLMYGEIDQGNDYLNALETEGLNDYDIFRLLEYLRNYVNESQNAERPPEAQEPPTVPLTGQPNAPIGTIITKNLDTDKTYGWKDALADLQDSLTIGGSLEAGLRSFLRFFQMIMDQCERFIQKGNDLVLMWTSKLDAFMKKTFSLLGGGSFEGSVLDCFVLNFEFPEILQIIVENLLCFLASLVNQIVGLIGDWIGALVNSILCLPLSILNALLQKVSAFLPQCLSFAFEFSPDIRALLQELSVVGDRCSGGMIAMGREVGAINLMVGNMSDRVKGFGVSASCATPANGFLSAMQL